MLIYSAVNVNKLKAFEEIKKLDLMQEKQRLENARREQRGDRMAEKLEVLAIIVLRIIL